MSGSVEGMRTAEILGDPYHKLVPLPRLQSRAPAYTPSDSYKDTKDTLSTVATAASAIRFLCRPRAGQHQRTDRTAVRRYRYILHLFTPKTMNNQNSS